MPARVVSPVLIGRRPELGVLERAFEKAAAGEPAIVLVGGEAGVGKSRLVEEAVDRGAMSAARVLTGWCVELGGEGLPFAPMVDALRLVLRESDPAEIDGLFGPARAELSRLLPELTPGESASSPSEASPTRLFELLLGLIERLAAERSLVLVVEDLHWADRSTLDLLAFLARALRSVPVLIVATYRADEVHRRHPLRPVLAELERHRGVDRIHLERFGREEVAAQLQSISDQPVAVAMADEVFERSQGNAFLVEELAGVLESGDHRLPPALQDVLLARVERLPAATQRVLQIASVAGARVDHALLAAVAGLPDSDLDEALRDAVGHHVLTIDESDLGFAFRHALMQEALYSDVLPGERVRLHTAYADALEPVPGTGGGAGAAAVLAHHRHAAHDLARALPASVDAGREAAGSYAYADALTHLERALEIWSAVPDAADRTGQDLVGLLELASSVASPAGEPQRAMALLDQALAGLDPSEEPARVARLLTSRGRVDRDLGGEHAVDDFERAAALLPEESPDRAAVMAALAAVHLAHGSFGEMAVVAAEAARLAARAGDARVEADALTSLGPALIHDGQHDSALAALSRALDLARGVGNDDATMRVHLNLSDAYEALGRHEEALGAALEGLELAQTIGLARTRGIFFAVNASEALLHLGRWDEAEALLDQAQRVALRGAQQLWLHAATAELDVGRGRWDEAEAHAEAADQLLPGDELGQDRSSILTVRAEIALARGDLHSARTLTDPVLAVDDITSVDRYAWPLVWLAARAEADVAQHARDRRVAVDDHHAGRLTAAAATASRLPNNVPNALTYRALAAAEGLRAAGLPSADAWGLAADAATDSDVRLRVYALFRQAAGALEENRRAVAAHAALDAAAMARRIGARPLLEDIEALARRGRLPLDEAADPTVTDGPTDIAAPPSPAVDLGLTTRELDVLRLVAAGRTNSQIAAELFISPKTASVHVSNILTKLAVSSRTEAAAVAHRVRLFDAEP